MTILVSVLILILTACSSDKNSSKVLSKSTFENEDSYSSITIQSPMTLSNNDLFPINGEHQYLRLKMVKGKYYEDWTPGAYMGTIWEGYFALELADESGNVISQTDLDKIYKEPLIFKSSFQIEFDDYNDDGDIDFTIGQYASSNGRNYKMFTLRNDGKVEELTVKNYSSLLLSNTTGFYSTKLTKVDNVTFKTEYYENSKGKNLEDIFRWDGKEFIKN
jgi:bla regulator protein BlaR1